MVMRHARRLWARLVKGGSVAEQEAKGEEGENIEEMMKMLAERAQDKKAGKETIEKEARAPASSDSGDNTKRGRGNEEIVAVLDRLGQPSKPKETPTRKGRPPSSSTPPKEACKKKGPGKPEIATMKKRPASASSGLRSSYTKLEHSRVYHAEKRRLLHLGKSHEKALEGARAAAVKRVREIHAGM